MSFIQELREEFSNKTKKPKELKKSTFQKVFRKVFWILLIFLVTKSVAGDVFKKEKEMEIPEIKIEQQKPAAIAASFTKEYLTYDIQKSLEQVKDYEKRVKTFSADYIKLPDLTSAKANSEVKNVFVYDIERINEDQYNVFTKADVLYSFPKGEKKKSSIYLKVPVGGKDGNFIVEDTPIMLPPPEKINMEYERFNQGEELYITEANKVKEIMENFFTTYCSGKPTEISYYLSNGKPTKGFEGRFTFLNIRDFRVYDLKVNNKFKAIAFVRLRDSISNKEFLQNYSIDLIKKDGRWYVEKLNLRGGNINEKYKEVKENGK
ncbi:MAG: conjugal transfer protein [Firmicutes bacterium]|nr:conjugal transfer protein [Bacillota bacterium]